MKRKYTSASVLDLPCHTWQIICSFLSNQEMIETLCLTRSSSQFTPMFTSITVRLTDNLMTQYRRFLKHKQSITRTILCQMNVSEEWPFESQRMVLVACKGVPKVWRTCREVVQYRYMYELINEL